MCNIIFSQFSASGLTPCPALYCQHLRVSNYSIKTQACQRKRVRSMMSMIAAGKARQHEWSAGRNVQFTAVWDFHLSRGQWRRERKRQQEERGVYLLPLFYLMNWIPTGAPHGDESLCATVCIAHTLIRAVNVSHISLASLSCGVVYVFLTLLSVLPHQ